MPNMRIRSKVAVTTQIPISTMAVVDIIRDEHRLKITNLFEAALESYITENYPEIREQYENDQAMDLDAKRLEALEDDISEQVKEMEKTGVRPDGTPYVKEDFAEDDDGEA